MANLTEEQLRIRSMIEAIGMVSARRLGIEDTQGFLNALLAVAWGENSWTAPAQGDIDIDGKPSYGVFQIRPGHKGVDKTPGELLDPYKNVAFAADYLGEVFKKYEDQGVASWQEIVPHLFREGQIAAVDRPDVQANIQNAIGFMEAQIGAVPFTPAVTGGIGGVEPDRNDPKYLFTEAQVGPGGTQEGQGGVGGFNYALYAADMDAWRLATTGEPTTGPDEIDYLNASVDLIAAQLSGEQIDVTKADMELRKRLGALEEAGRTYRELAPYALPEGTKWIPGGEPGGLYEQMGMGTMPTSLTRINPLAAALATLGRTPEMGPTTETSFEAALAGARQLREGMGATPEAAAPTSFEAALVAPTEPVAPAPVEEQVALTGRAGPQPVASPALGGGVTGSEEYLPYAHRVTSRFGLGPPPEPEGLSPEDAARIAQIILAILGSFGQSSRSQPFLTPTPTVP